jgi:hypothetical protein
MNKVICIFLICCARIDGTTCMFLFFFPINLKIILLSNYFRKWSMGEQSTTGSVLIFQGMCKTVLHAAFAVNLPRCVIYLAWYVYVSLGVSLLKLIFVY